MCDKCGTGHPTPMASHLLAVYPYTLSLTAGTSGPPAHTGTRRSQSEATGSEAASSPASPWQPPPGRSERQRKLSKSHEVSGDTGGHRHRDQEVPVRWGYQGLGKMTVFQPCPSLCQPSCYLLYSSFIVKGEREYFMSVFNKTMTPTLLFTFIENESLQTNFICLFIGKPQTSYLDLNEMIKQNFYDGGDEMMPLVFREFAAN